MSALILNREKYSLPRDGWYQLAPLGEFPHGDSGVVQVVDREACEAMAARFVEESKGPNFAGVLIDFDHFSLDAGSRSEAAGWITALEVRGEVSGQESFVTGEEVGGQRSEVGTQLAKKGQGGLWAKIRWSDLGEAAVSGGRYRFLSPVWARSDCEDLGNGRLRPVRLLNAAVTNDPNLKGMVPLSNSRGTSVGIRDTGYGIRGQADETLRNAEEANKRLKWELGNSPEDRHCPSCSALAGQVHSKAAWVAAGLGPKSGRLFCGEHCHCRLVETDEAERGDLAAVKPLYGGEVANRRMRLALICERLLNRLLEDTEMEMENTWSDEARAASLAVRRAKAAKRKDDKGAADGKDGGSGNEDESGDSGAEPDLGDVRDKLEKGEPLSDQEEAFLDKLMEDGYAGESDSDPIFDWMERRSEAEADRRTAEREGAEARDRDEGGASGDEGSSEEPGEVTGQESAKEIVDRIRKKQQGSDPLSPREQVLLDVLGPTVANRSATEQVRADVQVFRHRSRGHGSAVEALRREKRKRRLGGIG